MRYLKQASYIKIYNNGHVSQRLMVKLATKRLVNGKTKTKYDKGKLVRPIHKIRVGWDNDDFMKNQITVMSEQRVIKKVPRILKLVYESS